MVLDSFWFVHLNLRVEQGTELLHLLLFVRGYTVRPVTRMNLADRNFWWSAVPVGQDADLSWSCL